MKELAENESFCVGMNVGIRIYQQAVILAHKRKEPLKIGDCLYYVQDGRERLAEALEKMCR